jgi:acyl-coenzyme A synthetase/AMP-(fatty) acid ligase
MSGRPKGVVRDVGGYAVALAASMEYIFEGRAGDTMFTASDIGWVVGHSYIIYAPLIAGLTTVMYEGTPIRPDGGIWWRLVEQHRINLMFTAPTALRVLKKQDPALLKKSDLNRPQHGSPTHSANRWSTTTGRPRPAGRCSRSSAASKRYRRSWARRACRCTATT